MTHISFVQLINIEHTQRMLEDLNRLTGVPSAIMDNDGRLLIDTGRQEICTHFHREHPVTRKRCLDNDDYMREHLPGTVGKFLECRCGNGLRKAAVPIIIDGKILATLYIGQFILHDDKADVPDFLARARQFGFDEESYLGALSRVPVFTRDQIRDLLNFYRNLAQMMTEMGLKNLQLAREFQKRKQSDEVLRHSEAAMRRIFEAIPDQLHIIDKDFRILHSNWHGGYGYVSEEKRGRKPSCYEAFYSLDRPCENCHAIEVFTTGRPVVREKINPKIGHLEIHAYPVFDGKGEVEMVIEHVRNISERKVAEEKWHTLYNSLPGGSFTVNDQYIIEDVNDVLCAVTGFSREELVGQLCGIICPKGPHLCPIFDLGKERIDNDETAVKGKDGTLVPIIKSARRIPAGDRQIIVENFQDITDRKRLEEQLHHSQKMEAIGQLAGGIAHDFNNILTAIMGYANLLQMKIGDNDQHVKFTRQIISSAERASSLTRGLLAFSRRHVVDLKPVKVNEIIEKADKLLSRLVPENIELHIVTGGDFVVRADSMQVEQVLMNLVTNARDAMPGGGRLDIGTEKIELDEEFVRTHGYGRAGTFVRISVSDTGTGIDKHLLERIFEPFYTTKEVGKGTGLGLSIVYGIIKQHNGYINAYSEPGEGTVFKIYLPAIEGDAGSMEKLEMTAPSRGTETVLLAEDEPMVREIARSILEEFGYKVVEAEDGADAIEKFRVKGSEIKLLILDVIMPRKNGREVYDEIKKMRPDVEALFMSGYTDDILGGKGIIEEKLGYISKPLVQNVFLRKVREILDKRAEADTRLLHHARLEMTPQ